MAENEGGGGEAQTWPSENLSALHFAFYNANKKKNFTAKQQKPKRTFTL